jgi:hypothetical protein
MNTTRRARACPRGGLFILIISLAAGASAQAPAVAPSAPAAPPAAMGTLEFQQRTYYPQGCAHNGYTAICTFVLVNQGNMAQLNAWPLELNGLQFIDDAHVPHQRNKAYFMDKYGARQPQLLVQRGDQGTLVVEFPNVDPRVTTGQFQLETQLVGGIAVTQPGYAPPGAANTLTAGTPSPAGTPAAAPAAPPQQSTCTAANANTAGCRQIGAAQTNTQNQVNGAIAPVQSLQQFAAAFGFGTHKPAAAPAAATPASAATPAATPAGQ